MIDHRNFMSSLAILLVLASACGSAASAGRTRPPPGAAMAADAAAATIASARCEHESLCGEVGPGRTYATSAACVAEFAKSASGDLSAHPCPAGIDSTQVAGCTRLLAAETCHPLSTLSRMYTCRPANLCVRTGTVRLSDEDIYGD